MSDTKTVEIVVQAKSKTGRGIMDSSEQWYNADKKVSFDALNKRDKVQVTYVEGDKGGKFVVAFTKLNVAALPSYPIHKEIIEPATPVTTASATTAPFMALEKPANIMESPMSKAEWAAKDLLKVKGGVSHDAAQVVAAMCAMKSIDEVKALYTTVYQHILALVQE